MTGLRGFKDFNPAKQIPSLAGKVIFVTGGTAGLGAGSVRAFAAHGPLHIYFTGRNVFAAKKLISEVRAEHPTAALSFIEMDLSSMRSVKEGVAKDFKHDRLDILMNCAGIMAKPQKLSVDGYEIQFATNYLGHAMLTNQLLPYILATAKQPGADVRIINNTSDGHQLAQYIKGGISFTELDNRSTMNRTFMGPFIRYGQSKLANILFAAEFARRYPNITSVSIHPGLVKTPMNTEMKGFSRYVSATLIMLTRTPWLEPKEGVLNQLWAAAGAKREELRNGGFYRPIGVDCWDTLMPDAKDEQLAKKLWDWTEGVLAKV